MDIDQSTSDEPVPSGVGPYRLRASARSLTLRAGSRRTLVAWVTSAAGARLALQNPLNRVAFRVADPGVVRLVVRRGGVARVIGRRAGTVRIRLVYQRARARGGYLDVFNGRRPVAFTVRVQVRPG